MIPQLLRIRLLYLLGRADEAWYWFYQGALCRLGEDPARADDLYEQAEQQAQAGAWRSLVQRLCHGPDAVQRPHERGGA